MARTPKRFDRLTVLGLLLLAGLLGFGLYIALQVAPHARY